MFTWLIRLFERYWSRQKSPVAQLTLFVSLRISFFCYDYRHLFRTTIFCKNLKKIIFVLIWWNICVTFTSSSPLLKNSIYCNNCCVITSQNISVHYKFRCLQIPFLDVGNNPIHDDRVAVLARALHRIRKLSLVNCEISGKGIEALTAACKALDSPVRLDIDAILLVLRN